LVIAAFLVFAHYRAHRFLTELPRKLGADIRQETNSFTWSQTVKGRTVFTVHAAKAIQHKDGKYILHDVGITVYGRGEEQQNRIDHIYGKEFELDQGEGVVRALGEVHLDLQAPADTSSTVSKQKAPEIADIHEKDMKDPRMIHVKTSGLVYLQKLGVAATDQPIEFEYNGLTGHATGADYNTDSGVLLLHSAVQVSGLEHGKPVALTASRGELNRTARKIVLTQARFVTIDSEGKQNAVRQTVEAQLATAFLRKDGSTERLFGERGVIIASSDGSKISSQRGEVLLGESSKPDSVLLIGNVHYSDVDASHQASADAAEARGTFDGQGRLIRAVFNGSVHLLEHSVSAQPSGGTTGRELRADKVALALGVTPENKTWLQEVNANGKAHFQSTGPGKKGNETETNSIKGEALIARFSREDGQSRLIEIKSEGAAALEQRNGQQLDQTASGDSLDVTFQPSQTGSRSTGLALGGGDEVKNALLQGHVILVRGAQPHGAMVANSEDDRASAQRATYDGRTQRMLLIGAVELQNADGTLWADRVEMDQRSGDASAEGSIKVNYRQNNTAELLHVLAERADLKKSSDIATFYGSASRPARLWQGAFQLQAPSLQFDRHKQTLTARSEARSTAMAVHTVLVSSSAHGEEGHGLLGNSTPKTTVVRIASHEMVYSDETRTLRFLGKVRVESADSVMLGQQATAYFLPAQGKREDISKSQISGLPSGAVDRVVIEGDLEIQQQGRRATGERLVYTTSDGVYVLTGTEQQQPKVIDPIQGVVTGRELRFRQQDESVVISNGDQERNGPRVRTETRVKRK
jgi:lipopolysaccharide export system protein LptA